MLHFALCPPSPPTTSQKHISPISRLPSPVFFFFSPTISKCKTIWLAIAFFPDGIYGMYPSLFYSKNHVFHFHVMSVAESRFVLYNTYGFESKSFVLVYVFTEIEHYAFLAQSEPTVSEVTCTHSQKRWTHNSDTVSGF